MSEFLNVPAKLVKVNKKGNIILSAVDGAGNWYKIVLNIDRRIALYKAIDDALVKARKGEEE